MTQDIIDKLRDSAIWYQELGRTCAQLAMVTNERGERYPDAVVYQMAARDAAQSAIAYLDAVNIIRRYANVD